MIAEIRSYGTSMIIADQSPTKVSREVVANTDIKVAFRLVQGVEKELIADSTNMDESQKEELSRLRTGEAFVFHSLLDAPQLVYYRGYPGKRGDPPLGGGCGDRPQKYLLGYPAERC